ncbi:DNA cytosine methyltransferase [Janibacter melonis]|uniref:DNA cytosine methyltransferase n=1 Tax=Janibacter melonis TaxID=262209 RepID=UPI00174CB568|nr:DNA cytosine methyltransferase [Janibacter melonis]
MTLTLTDLFCGAGGSSTGAISVPGVEVRVASNHWQLAIETHNSNHQDADHICADLSQINPGYFPRTDLLWASPECTNHSRAKGRKRDTLQTELWQETLPDEAAERSRATMWDVVRFTEHHRYKAVIVENVVEIADWLPYRGWLLAMDALGYRVQVVSLNSMHAQHRGLPAPQSRDRVYVVFTLKTNPRPDLAGMQRPQAYCPTCDEVVPAMQAWKKIDRDPMTAGRYRSQYVYRCPRVTCRNAIVEPAWLPAASIIDWSLPGQRIGDRTKPLAEKTRARIAAGIARYWSPIHLEAAGNTYDAASARHPGHGNPNSYYRAWSMDEPLRSLHTSESKALAVPVEGRADETRVASMDTPLRTQSTRLETGLAHPPFVAELRGGGSTARPAADPPATGPASGNHPALIPSYYGKGGTRPADDALATVTAVDKHALVMTNTHGNRARPAEEEPTPTVTTAGGGGHALLTPAGGTWNDTAYPASQPSRTVTTRETTALVMRNNTGGAEMVTPAAQTLRTITTAGHQSVLTPGDIEAAKAHVDDVLFRMLEPAECKRAMAFPSDYRMLGNRREQVRLAGNAVTPPAARDLIACVIESLGVAA